MVTKWSSSGNLVVYEWSKSGLQVVYKFLVFDFLVLIFGFQYVLVGQQVCHRSQEESFKAVKCVKTLVPPEL